MSDSPGDLRGLFRLYGKLLGPDRVRFRIWVGVISTVYFFFLLPPYLLSSIVDFFTTYKPGQSLQPFYLTTVSLGVLTFITSVLRLRSKRILSEIGIGIAYRARVQGCERLLEHSLRWHHRENSGNKVQRLHSGAQALRELMEQFYQSILPIGASFVGVLGVFSMLESRFFLFAAVYLGLFIAIKRYYYLKGKQLLDTLNRASERSTGVLVEGASNILTVKSLAAGDSMLELVSRSERSLQERAVAVTNLWTRQWQLFQAMNSIALVLFIYLLGDALLRQLITVGSILMYYAYYTKLTESAGELASILTRLVAAQSAVARMAPIFEESDEQAWGDRTLPSDWRELRLDRISFRYPGAEGDQLDTLSLTIERGAKVGIAGESGSGKSTVARLLTGVYRIDRGSITFDGHSIYGFSRRSVSQQISVVLQETELFNLSLRDNLTLLKEQGDGVLAKALRVAELEGLIARLPEGLDTIIGEKGYRVSGGERQRIGIARALYRQPELLILDEATSALDAETEQTIHRRLLEEYPEVTMVVIAHRLSTLVEVDRLYVMEHGRVVEEGDFSALIGDAGTRFYRMYEVYTREHRLTTGQA